MGGLPSTHLICHPRGSRSSTPSSSPPGAVPFPRGHLRGRRRELGKRDSAQGEHHRCGPGRGASPEVGRGLGRAMRCCRGCSIPSTRGPLAGQMPVITKPKQPHGAKGPSGHTASCWVSRGRKTPGTWWRADPNGETCRGHTGAPALPSASHRTNHPQQEGPG